MDIFYFTEMPYAEFPESEVEKYPSMRLTFPNTYFDANKAHDLFKRYLDAGRAERAVVVPTFRTR